MFKLLSSIFFIAFSSMSTLAQVSDVVDVSEDAAKIEVQQKDLKKEKKEEPQNTADIAAQQLTSPNDKGIEKVEVTGSYIRRIDVEGPSPVVTFDREDFEVAGVDTVSDYLRESPLFEGSQDSGNRDGYFRFRGQHAGSTLVLINGMRIPKLGGDDRGFYSGVEAIPTNIIERVEVLKDGSSALYGSDAMAGVMNFITRKDYDGAEYSVRVNIPEINQGLQQNHTLAFGKSYSRGSWFVSTQYVEQRGFTEGNIGNYHRDPARPASSDGSINFINSNNDDSEKQDVTLPCPGGAEECEVDDRALSFVRDPRENIGTMLTGRYDINSDMTVSFVGLYNRRKRMDIGGPNYLNLDRTNNQTPLDVSQFGSNSLKQAAQAAGSDLLELNYRPTTEVGARRIEVLQNAAAAQTKLEGYFLDSWSWNLSGSYAYTVEERDHKNGLVDLDGLQGVFNNGYNPLDVAQNSGAFEAIGVQGVEAYETSLSTARMVATGELFEMSDLYGAGGPVSIAFGAEGQWETQTDAHDEILTTSNLTQNFGPNQTGNRTVTSVFTELVSYPLDSLELQLAGRFDEYSDFGSTLNPKVSLGFRPSKKFLLRTSWGTNFNAPSLRNMMYRDQNGFERFEVNDEGDQRFIPTVRYRDPNLRPETGENYNIGAVIQANKRWTFTIDQWNFHGKNTLSRLSPGVYRGLIDSIGFDEVANTGATFERDPDGTITSAVIPEVTNMGERIIRGLDLKVSFESPIRLLGKVMRAGAQMDHTHMLVYKTKSTPTSPFYNREDLEWKNTLSFALSTQRHSYRLAARTLAGDTTERTQFRTHTEYDFNYNYKLPWWTAKVTLGAKNLLNSRPPTDIADSYVNFDSGRNSYAFQALGRRYYIGYSQTF